MVFGESIDSTFWRRLNESIRFGVVERVDSSLARDRDVCPAPNLPTGSHRRGWLGRLLLARARFQVLAMDDMPMLPPPGWNPYSRAAWTELQLQFRPPRDGPSVSTHLRDYATAQELDVALAALQQVRWGRRH